MAGTFISALPAAPSALLTDEFPVDQLPGPVTYKETNAQILTLFKANGEALTKVNDTNVTISLSANANIALLNATSMTLGWTGTLAETRGGTAQSTYATGDLLYASAANTLSKLAGNITTAKQYLSQTGNGAASAAPSWATIAGTDITGAALTKGDDTNVTLTLGGTPATSLLRAASITAGWTGTLSGTRGGTGVNNGASTITLGGSLTTSGAFASTFTMTNTTSVTFPTSGTLATTSQIPTGAALTKTDDTNVTLSLGGSPTTALVNAASLTLGWTGTLAASRGGTGISSLGTGIATWLGQTFTAPTVQKFTSGSGTYTTPTSPPAKYIRVVAVGGGGGGTGNGSGAGVGGTGGNTTFGTTLIVANGAAGPVGGSTASLGAAVGVAFTGGTGCQGTSLINASGGQGAPSPYGGAGVGGAFSTGGAPAVTNTGSGGGGAGGTSSVGSTLGGGSGAYVDGIIASPSATYSYTVGAAGAAGTAGSGGFAGGAGAAGIIVVYEYYQ